MAQIRRFFSDPPIDARRFGVRGVGVREWMRPGIVNRPRGTGDYLLMLFHHPVEVLVDGDLALYPAHSIVSWSPGHPHVFGNKKKPWRHSWLHCQGRMVDHLLPQAGLLSGHPALFPKGTVFEDHLVALHDELSNY